MVELVTRVESIYFAPHMINLTWWPGRKLLYPLFSSLLLGVFTKPLLWAGVRLHVHLTAVTSTSFEMIVRFLASFD